jgi:asparagine synthase (glutamine-hydrolysing)
MSAQAGIHYFDRRCVPPAVSAALAATLATYGPDGGGDASPAPGVAMIARRLQVTPEDHADVQPVQLAHGSWLTWDGRLDNREDLMMALGMRPSAEIADVQVVALAIERWGDEDTWPRLVGDWSAVLWSTGSRTVTLATDFMGVRPLYYVITDSYCAWSTALEGLLAITGRRSDLDDVFFVCSVICTRMPGHTPYRDIRVVVSGHRVRVDAAGAANVRQYWRLPQSTIRYHDPRDYQAHLRAVFSRAVQRRLRSDRPVWMELSGGWDSSTIVCMAARLREQASCTAPALHTASHVSPADPESDETRFIEAVEAHVHVPSMHIVLDRTATPIVPNPVYFRTTLASELAIYERMRSSGARVLMSGRFGDGVMGNFPVDTTDATAALRALRPMRALGECRAWALATQDTAWSMLADALVGLAPAWLAERRDLRDALRSLTGSRGATTRRMAAQLGGAPGGMAHLEVIVRTQTAWRLRNQSPHVNRHVVAGLALYALNQELSSPAEGEGVLATYPFADRDLVEFVTAIPARVLCEPGRPRALMRDAFVGLLPERIHRRFSKGYAAPFRTRLVQQHAPALLRDLDVLHVVTRRFVDPSFLRTQLQLVPAGAPHDGSFLLRVLLIEQWLTALASERSAAA